MLNVRIVQILIILSFATVNAMINFFIFNQVNYHFWNFHLIAFAPFVMGLILANVISWQIPILNEHDLYYLAVIATMLGGLWVILSDFWRPDVFISTNFTWGRALLQMLFSGFMALLGVSVRKDLSIFFFPLPALVIVFIICLSQLMPEMLILVLTAAIFPFLMGHALVYWRYPKHSFKRLFAFLYGGSTGFIAAFYMSFLAAILLPVLFCGRAPLCEAPNVAQFYGFFGDGGINAFIVYPAIAFVAAAFGGNVAYNARTWDLPKPT
ncbi:hypothetical protein MASR2M15_25380 [Anaerolineales bacterium]